MKETRNKKSLIRNVDRAPLGRNLDWACAGTEAGTEAGAVAGCIKYAEPFASQFMATCRLATRNAK